MTRASWRLGLILLCLGLFGCDHATKAAAHAALGGGKIVAVVPHVELLYTENHDTAFSLLGRFGLGGGGASNAVWLLAASALALGLVLAAWFRARRSASRLTHVGFALVLAGALGNVVDRALRGFVVDFIHVSRWPVFNVADVAVVIGVALLAWTSARRQAPANV